MKKITPGFTNISYISNDNFAQEKKKNGFNHNIDYTILNIFKFVPKLMKNDENFIEWEFIEGENPIMNDENIIKIAEQLKEIHNSKLKFPKFNIKGRVKEYLKILSAKNINIPKLNEYYLKINKILANMKKDTPCHNDLWPVNMIKRGDEILFVDWEYATMNDKHFDLAYFIETSKLSDEQETLFLNTYGDYNYEYVLQNKILVNYLVVLWVNSQPIKYFDDTMYIQNMDKYSNEILQRRINTKRKRN
ncbi:phosphotransferase [Mycoplasma sp. M5725]|uniref:Phosphotransferase n=1 Tax=Mycoplasma phocimorsus TaxID=3045839 RepID=A0AAJ1PTI0_9MOLU|nr:phosphotransferase [Mycoplasma phocimorsus]MDJ1645590.1 phosphotransferase [Mycoplasma phocimorsus]MDJ1646557.1 phosphotransferase [Mycoplasma phocimorsus]